MVRVISLGGSIVAPDGVDTEFLSPFIRVIEEYMGRNPDQRLVFIVGGGGPARHYQEAYKTLSPRTLDTEVADRLDWIGIMATRLNAELIRHCFGPLCMDPVVIDPTGNFDFQGRILVGAGWKPGFSTDFDAVLLAERFRATQVINLSNVQQVYTADPKIDPAAKPLDRVSWEEFHRMVGDSWTPGSNLPFDPVATSKARKLGLQVIAAGGRDLDNLQKILEGKPFFGTLIGE